MTPTNRLPQSASSCNIAKTEEYIRSRPDESVLMALAAGAAVGVALGIVVGGSRGGGAHSRRVAEGLGERLMHSLERVLPDSIHSVMGGK